MKRSTQPLSEERPLLRLDAQGRLVQRTYFVNVRTEQGPARELAVGARLVVGSGPDAGLVLDDAAVSRMHVELEPRAEGLRVRDLDSRNGTFLGTLRIQDVVVSESAQLRVGRTVLRIEAREDRADLPDDGPASFGGAVSQLPTMQRLFGLLERAARSDSSILLLGETGVGKDVLARAIHASSPRREHPFVVVDCGAVSPALIESELFGHVKGAFTGAVATRSGAFVEARQGTVFLDEIGELPLALQPMLLRALDSRTVKPVGADATREVDVRIIAATHRDLRAEVAAGRFRQDLYFRLSVVSVAVPPLRERLPDLPLLVRQFLERAGKQGMDISEELRALFEGYSWPGNVRELRNVVERALTGMPLERPLEVERSAGAAPHRGADLSLPFKEAKQRLTDEFTRAYLENLSALHNGNLSRMARSAGIARHYLRELLQRCKLYEGSVEDDEDSLGDTPPGRGGSRSP